MCYELVTTGIKISFINTNPRQTITHNSGTIHGRSYTESSSLIIALVKLNSNVSMPGHFFDF